MSGRKEKQLESEATRVKLLDAGLELLRDDPEAAVAEVVTARKVYARAKLSSGAFYAHFDSQEHYLEQLTAYALAMDPIPELSGSMEAFLAALDAGWEPYEGIIAGGAAALRSGDGDMTIPLTLMRRARARPGNQAMAEIQAVYELVQQQSADAYEAVLAMCNRELRPPYSIRDLVTAITILNEGSQLRRAALPDDVPDDLLGSLMLAVLELHTRRVGDSKSKAEWLADVGTGWVTGASM